MCSSRHPLLSVLLILSASLWGGIPAGADPAGATLRADHATVAPGQTFRVGVHLRLEPGWHVYWKNPGDTGLPTTVVWKLPAGWSAGPLEWPVPHRFTTAGVLVSYGYEKEVVLFAPVTAPADAGPGSYRLEAALSWLACNADTCLPGKGSAAVTMRVGAEPVPLKEPAFATWSAKVPRPASDPACPFTATIEGALPPAGESGGLQVVLAWKKEPPAGSLPEIFPAMDPSVWIIESLEVEPVKPSGKGSAGAARITLQAERRPGESAGTDPGIPLVISSGGQGFSVLVPAASR